MSVAISVSRVKRCRLLSATPADPAVICRAVIVGFAMTGVGLFLMLSSFLYYLIRSRSSYSGQSHMPVMRVATTLVVMLSWLGGMALLLLFAPINADRAVVATRFHSYLLSFTCLFVLIVFIAIKGAFERSQTNAMDNRQMDQSIAEALRRFGAPASVPASSGMLGGSSQAQSRPYTAQRRRAGVRDSAAAPSLGIMLSDAELRNLALDAKVCQEGDHAMPCIATLTLIFHPICALQESRERELSTTANLCVGLAASALLPLAPVIVFATAIVVAILRALYNLFCSCSRNGAPVAHDKGARSLPTGVPRGSALQEPLIVVR